MLGRTLSLNGFGWEEQIETQLPAVEHFDACTLVARQLD